MDGTRPAPKVMHLAQVAHPAAREDSITEVVVVSFNAGRYLQTCVESVLQSSVPVRVLVVDNASTDGSLEQLGESHGCDSRLRILRNSDNLGFARANNRALATCNSRYVLVLNPDCFLGHDTLDRLRRVMDSDPSIGLAGCMVRNPDGTEQAGTRRSIPTPWRTMVRILHLDRLFPDRERFRNFVLTGQPLPKEPVYLEGVSGACMFVRREAMRQVGLMDEGYFLHCEDLDWFMRFRSAGWRIAFVPDVEVTHIKGGCSRRHPVRVLWHKHQGMVRFYKKFFRHQYPLPLMWGVIAAVWARFACLCLFSLILGRVGSPQAVD
jgi:GT2 family glycosyltransferase